MTTKHEESEIIKKAVQTCVDHPKSFWWVVGFACAGIGSGYFFSCVAAGIISLVLGHLMDN